MKNQHLIPICFFILFFMACEKGDLALDTGNSGISGSITRFVVYQNFLYGLNLNEVQTYDLTQANQPKLVHSLKTDYGLETITIYDNTIYLGSATALYILNISNPAMPEILSQTPRIEEFSGCDPVVVKDNYAYSTIKIITNICGIASAQSALIVFDVTDKSSPKQIGEYDLDIPNGLGIKDNFLLVCDEGTDQILIFDISDPENLKLKNFSIHILDPVDLIVLGNKLIVSTKTTFEIYDLSEIENIRKLGSFSR